MFLALERPPSALTPQAKPSLRWVENDTLSRVVQGEMLPNLRGLWSNRLGPFSHFYPLLLFGVRVRIRPRIRCDAVAL